MRNYIAFSNRVYERVMRDERDKKRASFVYHIEVYNMSIRFDPNGSTQEY